MNESATNLKAAVTRDPIFRDQYRAFFDIDTRWMDNDIYGHVNNVTYYSYFDSAANRYLIEHCGLDIHNGEIIGFVVNSGCQYLAPIAFPDRLDAGVRVDKLGNSSVQYGIAIFRAGETSAVAHGHFVHVFVNRVTQKSVPIPAVMRAGLQAIAVDQA
jgi:acyl-CoA thioester hydrolase